MYGMIHRAVRQLVLDQKGRAAWEAIEVAAEVTPADFISSATYDDIITTRLLDEAARSLGMETSSLLRQFGAYWVVYAGRGYFSPFLDFTGRDLITFLSNLDLMHKGIHDVMPQSKMPSFKVKSERPGNIVVEYRSTRRGLTPFVEGLMEGLLARFNLDGKIIILSETPEVSVLSISYKEISIREN